MRDTTHLRADGQWLNQGRFHLFGRPCCGSSVLGLGGELRVNIGSYRSSTAIPPMSSALPIQIKLQRVKIAPTHTISISDLLWTASSEITDERDDVKSRELIDTAGCEWLWMRILVPKKISINRLFNQQEKFLVVSFQIVSKLLFVSLFLWLVIPRILWNTRNDS